MSLPVLAILVVVGIALIVLAIHLTGGSRAALMDGEDHARAVFAADHPNLRVHRVDITADRRSAFLHLDPGRSGLVHAMGLKFLTRVFAPGEIGSVERDGDRALLVRLGDFTFDGGRFEFASKETADAVSRLLRRPDDIGRRAA
jgi:hypothetical protein